MGNVLASSKAAAGADLALPPSADPLPIDSADPTKSTSTAAGSLLQGYTFDELENPGSMEELHKRCKGNAGDSRILCTFVAVGTAAGVDLSIFGGKSISVCMCACDKMKHNLNRSLYAVRRTKFTDC